MSPTPAREAIAAILAPRSIAFVGASTNIEKTSGLPFRNVLDAGFAGRTYPINRRGGEIAGQPALADIEALPEAVDVAYITIPAEQCAEALRDLARKGVRTAIVGAGGFAETGSDGGRRHAADLRQALDDTGIRIVGPVCNGVYSTMHNLALGSNAIHRRKLAVGNVALISHSGALVGPFVTMLERAGAGLSHFVSVGAEADLTLSDFVDYLADNADTDVIAIIVDHVGDGDAFRRAVSRARENGKEIVALKLGESDLGREATLAHSSHLSGSAQVYRAIFAMHGIRSVPTVEIMATVCAVLGAGRSRERGGIVASSTSGGGAIILADLLQSAKLPQGAVPSLADRTVTTIASHLRFDSAMIMNPFDLGLGGRDHYGTNIAALAADPSAAVLIVYGTPMATPAKRAQLASAVVDAACANPDLPVLYLSPAPLFDDEVEILRAGGIPVTGSTLDSIAIACALLPRPPTISSSALPASTRAAAGPARPLPEHLGKARLKGTAPLPPEKLATTLDEALLHAETIGYPVVAKASGEGIWHKSELGLVLVGIDSPDALRAAWSLLQERLAAHPELQPAGILVGRFVTDGVEAIIGFTRDAEFGPIGIVGLGGTLAELFGPDAVAHLPLPIREADARAALAGTPLETICQGYRGAAAKDLDAFIALVVAIGQAVVDEGGAFEALDLNPVKILDRGQGAWPLDALWITRDRPESSATDTTGDGK